METFISRKDSHDKIIIVQILLHTDIECSGIIDSIT